MPSRRYLVSNFRELLAILESLRVSRNPGRGMRHVSPRPMIEAPLRESEAALITGGKTGEFTVLLEIDEACALEGGPEQAKSIPVTSIMRVIFRTEHDRDVVLNRTFENASAESLTLAVDESMFDDRGEARFAPSDQVSPADNAGWQKADWIGGGLAAAFAASKLHPASISLSEVADLEVLPGKKLFDLLGQPAEVHGPLDALVNLLAHETGSADLYGEELLRRSVSVLGNGGVDSAILERFVRHMEGILASDIVRKPGELSDDGCVPLRALSMLIQRPTTEEVLADRARGEFPGLRVFLTAAMLSGVREGLARLPWGFKGNDVSLLGTICALIEDDPDQHRLIGALIQERLPAIGSGTPAEAGARMSQFPRIDEGGALNLEICKLGSKTTARALLGLASKGPSWRIICGEEQTLYLQVTLRPEDDVEAIEAEAKTAVQAWKKRTAVTGRQKGSKQAKSQTSDTLPGILEPS